MLEDSREQLVAWTILRTIESEIAEETKHDLIDAALVYFKVVTAQRFMVIAKERVNTATDARDAYRKIERIGVRLNEHERKAFDRLDNLLELLPDEMDRPVVERPSTIPTGHSYPPRAVRPKSGD